MWWPRPGGKNALNSAASSSMLSTRPRVRQEQAPALRIPSKGAGEVGLASDQPQQPAFPSSPTPPVRSRVQGVPACLSRASFHGEGRSHLELHLERKLTGPQEGGWGQGPGSNPGLVNTSQ